MPSLLLLVNRHSRYGEAGVDGVAKRLSSHGFTVQQVTPDTPAEGVLLLRRYCAMADVIVVGGGDGTFNQLGAALARCGRPVGILPLGTANDLAHSLNIPNDPDEAAEVIVRGIKKRIDYGEANGVAFFNAANVGLGTSVDLELTTREKRRWGVIGYLRALRRAWKRNQPFVAEIVCDGRQRREHLMHLVVGNGRRHGGGILIQEEADVADGIFHLYGIRPQPWWRLPRTATGIWRGAQPGSAAMRDDGREIRITTSPPLPVAADGELITHTPTLFRVVPEAIEVFVPEADS
ncbi:lipid kinase [Thiohalomonas denitrificans]|uniref:lipid kinase n=1 Tax=Thiohalomonas denitrificans TaxID=415747 RepID=UPI0015867C9B|nr:lipid kinase [Thiohalomonas denitrificans]